MTQKKLTAFLPFVILLHPPIPYKMSSVRITRSASRATAEAEHTIPPVVVAVPAPHNIISEMPHAIPVDDVHEPAAPPAISTPPHKIFATIRFVGNSNECVEIAYKDHNLYICEQYVNILDATQTVRKVVELHQIQKWLRLWFKTAQLDQHNSWKNIEVIFALLPCIMTRRECLTDERIDHLVSHIMASVTLLYEISE
jgi:hypothetical protein